MLQDVLPRIDAEMLDASGSFPVVLEGAKRLLSEGSVRTRPSVHQTYELTYMRRGHMTYTINKKDYEVAPGDSIVIKPRREHTYVISDSPAELIVLYFEFVTDEGTKGQANGKSAVSATSIKQFFDWADGESDGIEEDDDCFVITGNNRDEVSQLAERILQEYTSDQYEKDLMMHLLAVELVIYVARAIKDAWERSLRVRDGKIEELVAVAKEFIDENYNKDLSVADCANYVFLSQGYFARAFREIIGKGPMAYLIQVRIDEACTLLEDPDVKVSSIALRVGFSSPQRFNAAFRKQMDMTPMEYRKKLADGWRPGD